MGELFVSTWTASKVFDRIILHNFRYCVQQQVGTTKILTNFSIRVLQLIRKNLNLFHRPEKHLSHMIGMLCIKRSLGETYATADSAQTALLSTFRMLVAGVTSQLFSIIWWFRAWKQCIFWKHVILAISVHQPNPLGPCRPTPWPPGTL